MGFLADGKKVIARIENKDGRPTLEIQFPNSYIRLKIRYN